MRTKRSNVQRPDRKRHTNYDDQRSDREAGASQINGLCYGNRVAALDVGAGFVRVTAAAILDFHIQSRRSSVYTQPTNYQRMFCPF